MDRRLQRIGVCGFEVAIFPASAWRRDPVESRDDRDRADEKDETDAEIVGTGDGTLGFRCHTDTRCGSLRSNIFHIATSVVSRSERFTAPAYWSCL